MLGIFGCNPKDETALGAIVFWIFSITGIVYTICSLIKCAQQTSLEIFSITYIDYVVASQTTFKVISLYLNKTRLNKLLDIFWFEFWPADEIQDYAEKHNRMLRTVMRGSNTYRGILILCIVQISLTGVLAPSRQLTYNLFFFGYEYDLLLTSPYYQLMYFFEVITLSVAYALCLIGHDMLYISLSGSVIVQFDILKYKLINIGEKDMDEETSYQILRKCIAHHNMLLKFTKELERIVTFPILKQYLDAISCMGIYIYLSQQNFHFLYAFSLMTNLSQTLFFSSFGQMIQDRSAAIGDAAYNSKWYLVYSRRLQQALILVILRSQRRTRISAGGFIFLSFESFVGMLKTAGSFLAVLRSTKE